MSAAIALAAALAAPSSPASSPPSLGFPVACDLGRTCEIQHYVDRDPGPGTRDYRCGLQTYEGHNGVDFRLLDMAAERRGVAVLAAAPGRVARLRDGMADVSVATSGGVSTVANRECGNGVVVSHGGGWETQYCHLAQGSIRVKVGDMVQAGTPLAQVGLSGATEFPHLHFTVRRDGQVVDPFAPDPARACGAAGATLWRPEVAARMVYRAGAVLNAGFTDAQPTMASVEAGGLRSVTAASPAMIAYVRAIGLLPGDVVQLELKGPDGAVLARGKGQPLARWRAQDLLYVGARRPTAGWRPGVYVADYRVLRRGASAINRQITVRMPATAR